MGKVKRSRSKDQKKKKKHQSLTGILHLTGQGYGSINTELGEYPVFPEDLRGAMDRDEVKVYIKRGRTRDKAVVIDVVNRAAQVIMGIYRDIEGIGMIDPLDNRMTYDFYVYPQKELLRRLNVKDGDIVVAQIMDYPYKRTPGSVKLLENKGPAEDFDLAIEQAIEQAGIRVHFPEEVVESANALECEVDQALAYDETRRDLRDKLCFTIDPIDAKDFDDAVCAQELEDGSFKLDVYIADVSHYVHWKDVVDKEAQMRTCSAYLVDRVIPMLPEKLCNDICSLRPLEDRLAMGVSIHLSSRGKIINYDVFSCAIRSAARLDYGSVDKFLTGEITASELNVKHGKDQEVAQAILALQKIAHHRIRIQKRRGSLEFETKETHVLLDEQKRPVDVIVRQTTEATSLVEQAMLLANECVARTLASRDIPAAYRVHEAPDPDALVRALPVLFEFDLIDNEDKIRLGMGDPFAIQDILERAKGTDAEYIINQILLRCQSRAVYKPMNEGHFALGAPMYCHFTSPIRRYPDVIVHRKLKSLAAGTLKTNKQEKINKRLSEICLECSTQERVADKLGYTTHGIKMAEMYEDKVGERFSAIISGVASFGFFVTLDDTFADGLVPIRTLPDDWYEFDEERMLLHGVEKNITWRLGQRVVVELRRVDVVLGKMDFVVVPTIDQM